jgi:hypothetical protein
MRHNNLQQEAIQLELLKKTLHGWPAQKCDRIPTL